MPLYPCVECRHPVHVHGRDVAIAIVPVAHACGAPNMLSRRTPVLALVPSILPGRAVSLANGYWWDLWPSYPVTLTGYAVGVAPGLVVAERWGALDAPYGASG